MSHTLHGKVSGFFWCKVFDNHRYPMVMQNFGWGPRREFDTNYGPMMRSLCRLTDSLTRLGIDRGKVALFGQSQPLADFISRALKRPVGVMPMPQDWDRFPPRREPAEKPVVSFVGEARVEKGLSQFVDALSLTTTAYRVEAVATKPSWEAPEILPFGIPRRPGDTWRHHPLSDDEYVRFLAGLDVMVLPYRPDSFVNRTSNMLAEALGLGQVVVAPAGTWMADVMQTHDVGVVYSPYSAVALARAIDRAVEDFAALRAESMAFAPEWRAKNSAQLWMERALSVAQSRG